MSGKAERTRAERRIAVMPIHAFYLLPPALAGNVHRSSSCSRRFTLAIAVGQDAARIAGVPAPVGRVSAGPCELALEYATAEGVDKRDAQVVSAQRMLQTSIERLDHVAGLLIGRLDRVMRPPTPAPDGPTLAEIRAGAPLADDLEGMARAIDDVTDRLVAATERLEV